jgi:hypothetical protein
MGTTADKLNKILETKESIKQAIIAKGVDVGEDTKFADYPSRIAAIQTGSGEGTGDSFFNMRTDNGTNFSYLFYNYNGSELDLSGLDTSQVTNMILMFGSCYSLSILDIRNFDMSNVYDIGDMFWNCSRLHKLRLDNCGYDTINKIINSTNLPTGQVNVDGEYINRTMYVQEANIVGLMAPDGWEFVYVESSEGGEPGLPTPGMPGTGGGDEPEGPTVTPDPEPSEPGGGEVGPVIPPEGTEEPTDTYVISFSTIGSKKLTVNNVDVTDQVIETSSNTDGTISCKYETTDVIRQASFKDNTDLVRVFGLDTSMMFHTEEMFSGCTSLVAILPMLESDMAYSTRAMFKNCTSLTSMDTIGNFSTASNKSEMFYNCSSLTGTVPSWNYWLNGAVTEYADCFHNCTSLDNYSEIPASWGGPDDSE